MSPEATADLEKSIVDYLINVWGEKAAIDFGNEVDRILEIVSKNPELFPLDDEGTLRKAVIVKQITLLYTAENDIIELIRFWDNRQNPAKFHK